MPNLQSGMAPVSQSWSKYTKIIWEKVSHSPVYVSHSYHLGVALVGNATPERGFSDKNVSFLWCFSKISNFRFFIIRSCFYSLVVSLFGPSALPLSPGQMNSSSTPSCTIDITQHALKGQKLCKLSGVLNLLPLQGALFTTHKNPGRCPGLGASAPSGRAAYIGILPSGRYCLLRFLAFWVCYLYGL